MSYNKIYYSTGYTGYLKAGETMDKTKLISLVRCGDEKAVNELYYRTYRQPYTLFRDVVNSVSDAYGIMQDAYREAFLHIDRISDYACFSKAINRLSLFMGAVFLKKDKGYAPFADAPDTTFAYIEVLSGEFKPEPGVDYSSQRQTVSDMLKNLPPDERLALLARCVLGLSINDISYSFGVSETTAAIGLNYAAFRMKAQAERTGFDSQIPVDNLFSFIAWSFGKAASDSPVHEMNEDVKQAALSAAARASEPEELSIPAETELPVNTAVTEQKSPQEYLPGENIQPEQAEAKTAPKPKRHLLRNIVIISVSVLFLAAGTLSFIAFALPQITGEPNSISKFITGRDAENTPEELVEQFEAAFNKNDRDAMAKLFLPDQSLERNIEGGALQLINGLFGLFNSGNTPQIECELKDLKKDGETAKGKVLISAELPLVGKQSITLNASFEIKDNRWYFKELKA